MDVCGLSVEKADDFFAALKLTEFELKIAERSRQGNPRAPGLPEKCRPGISHA
jgi:hypothetical protein